MKELKTKRGEYIRASASQIWQALTDPDMTEQYLGGSRIQSSFQPGAEITYVAPDRSTRLLEGTLLEVEPNRRLVFKCRLLFDPRFAAEQPHRESFEIEEFEAGVCKLTATFDQYQPGSLAYEFACDTRGGMDLTGSSLKSLLETGRPIQLASVPSTWRPEATEAR